MGRRVSEHGARSTEQGAGSREQSLGQAGPARKMAAAGMLGSGGGGGGGGGGGVSGGVSGQEMGGQEMGGGDAAYAAESSNNELRGQLSGRHMQERSASSDSKAGGATQGTVVVQTINLDEFLRVPASPRAHSHDQDARPHATSARLYPTVMMMKVP